MGESAQPDRIDQIAGTLQEGFALGAADYLTKPIEVTRLSSMLQRYRV
jgi:response regulator of citrate/malate metabolism